MNQTTTYLTVALTYGYTSVRKCILIEIRTKFKEWTGDNISNICKRYDVSRKIYYKWKNRYEKKGLERLSKATANYVKHVSSIWSVCIRCRKIFTSLEDGLCRQSSNEVNDLGCEGRFEPL
jgi:hypothetical protein